MVERPEIFIMKMVMIMTMTLMMIIIIMIVRRTGEGGGDRRTGLDGIQKNGATGIDPTRTVNLVVVLGEG